MLVPGSTTRMTLEYKTRAGEGKAGDQYRTPSIYEQPVMRKSGNCYFMEINENSVHKKMYGAVYLLPNGKVLKKSGDTPFNAISRLDDCLKLDYGISGTMEVFKAMLDS